MILSTHEIETPVTIDFKDLFSRSPNAYAILNPELRFVWTNEAYLSATMRIGTDLTGKTMFEAFPSDPSSESHRLLEHSFREVLRTGETDDLALIRYDIPQPDGKIEVRYWSATHTPLKDDTGAVSYILQHTVDVTGTGLRAMQGEMGVIQRARAVQARNLHLAEELDHCRALFEQAPGFIAILQGPDHAFQIANAAYRSLVGRHDLIGRPVAEALPEIVSQGFIDVLDRVRATAVPYFGRREKVLLEDKISGEPAERFLDFIYQPIFSEKGGVSGIFVQGQDVTEQVKAENRQTLLMNELNHRVKNTLAVVQGLAMQSFRQLPGSEHARQTFSARLGALAAAHNLLTSNEKAAGLIDTVRGAIEASAGQDAERCSISGPDMLLNPQTAVSLAMIMHELVTNAVKYGALSAPEGRIDVRWISARAQGDGTEAAPLLNLIWTESGGPPAEKPTRRGFGSRLIEHGLSTEQASKVDMQFLPGGLQCTIMARLPNPVP